MCPGSCESRDPQSTQGPLCKLSHSSLPWYRHREFISIPGRVPRPGRDLVKSLICDTPFHFVTICVRLAWSRRWVDLGPPVKSEEGNPLGKVSSARHYPSPAEGLFLFVRLLLFLIHVLNCKTPKSILNKVNVRL